MTPFSPPSRLKRLSLWPPSRRTSMLFCYIGNHPLPHNMARPKKYESWNQTMKKIDCLETILEWPSARNDSFMFDANKIWQANKCSSINRRLQTPNRRLPTPQGSQEISDLRPTFFSIKPLGQIDLEDDLFPGGRGWTAWSPGILRIKCWRCFAFPIICGRFPSQGHHREPGRGLRLKDFFLKCCESCHTNMIFKLSDIELPKWFLQLLSFRCFFVFFEGIGVFSY